METVEMADVFADFEQLDAEYAWLVEHYNAFVVELGDFSKRSMQLDARVAALRTSVPVEGDAVAAWLATTSLVFADLDAMAVEYDGIREKMAFLESKVVESVSNFKDVVDRAEFVMEDAEERLGELAPAFAESRRKFMVELSALPDNPLKTYLMRKFGLV
jgi:hypothetical protein